MNSRPAGSAEFRRDDEKKGRNSNVEDKIEGRGGAKKMEKGENILPIRAAGQNLGCAKSTLFGRARARELRAGYARRNFSHPETRGIMEFKMS